MGLTDYKITDAQISEQGVVAAPDRLSGSPQENKAVFDRLIREAVKGAFNAIVDTLVSGGGAAEIGAGVDGLSGSNVQSLLTALKVLADSKAGTAAMDAALLLKANTSVTDTHFKAVSFDEATGVFTFTKENGSSVSVNTALEKVAVNWKYDENSQSLVLELADGSTQSVPLSAFITDTEFVSGDTIEFSVSGGKVSATVKSGSITDSMLDSALLELIRSYVAQAAASATEAQTAEKNAETSKTSSQTAANTAAQGAADASNYAAAAAESEKNADEDAKLAKSYSVGGTSTRSGEDADNAKYFMEQSKTSAENSEKAATRTEVAAVHQPIVQNGTWWTWDISSGEYIDTGISAEGPEGKTGPSGKDGRSFTIKDVYGTLDELRAAFPTGNDYAYQVTAENREIFIWSTEESDWVSMGALEGPAGVTFTPHLADDGTLSWSNDGGLTNPESVNITGPDGKDGEKGTTFTPAVDDEGNLSWSNDGEQENPETKNIRGPAGKDGADGDPFTYDMFTEEQLAALTGPAGKNGSDGKDGATGPKGADGTSVTHSWDGTNLTLTSASGTTTTDLGLLYDYGTSDLTPGTSELAAGRLYFVIEI